MDITCFEYKQHRWNIRDVIFIFPIAKHVQLSIVLLVWFKKNILGRVSLHLPIKNLRNSSSLELQKGETKDF